MHDGRTRKVDTLPPAKPAPFLESHRATLTILRGPAAGTEIELDRPRMIREAAEQLTALGVNVRDIRQPVETLSGGRGVGGAALRIHGGKELAGGGAGAVRHAAISGSRRSTVGLPTKKTDHDPMQGQVGLAYCHWQSAGRSGCS